MSRRAFIGRDFTRQDNGSLPCTIKLLPSGTCYGTVNGQLRRLDTLKSRLGIHISLPDEFDGREVLLQWDGRNFTVLVDEEIVAGKKKEPVPLVKQNSALIEEGARA